MVDHIPSLMFCAPAAEIPTPLREKRSIPWPSGGEAADRDWSVIEDGVYALVNRSYQSGELWRFTSTNYWYEKILADIAEALHIDGLSFLRSICSVLDAQQLREAIAAIEGVAEQLSANPEHLELDNSDWPVLLEQIRSGFALRDAQVTREVDEWTTPNAFGSFLLSLRASLREALERGQLAVFYQTHA
jgi:hypothetical protein